MANPLIQKIVPPERIESEIKTIWEGLKKTDKVRACLFNLIVIQRASPRTDYWRDTVQKLIEKFPCRILFVSHDPDPAKNYLKSAVSVVAASGDGGTACDMIDIGVAGSDWERVPFLLLPHILPDLPVYLLWTEDPSKPHPLFAPLEKLATRLIFDSETTDDLAKFSKALIALKDQKGKNVADLNWARTEGWRELLSTIFDSDEKVADLKNAAEIKLVYNAHRSDFFTHLNIQVMYLLAHLTARLGWQYESVKKEGQGLRFSFKDKICIVDAADWNQISPGAIISFEAKTKKESTYSFARNPQAPHHLVIQTASADRCELPYQYVIGKWATGQSLASQIFQRGTSSFFLDALRLIPNLDCAHIC